MRTRFLLTLALLTAGCNDNRVVRDDGSEPPPTPEVPEEVPPEFQPRIFLVWDASDRMLDIVQGLDLDGDGSSGAVYDPEDDWQYVFSCGDDNDTIHPTYGTTWNSWDHASNTRYDLMLGGLLPFLDQGAQTAADGNLFARTILDPATAPATCDFRANNGKDDNHDSQAIDIAMIALGTSYGLDHRPSTADDDVCRFKEETLDLRAGGGPVRSFFHNLGLPADTNTVAGITHNDWVADQALYSDPGGPAQIGRALEALAAPADGALDSDGLASIRDVMARDANAGCRPYAVVLVSAGIDVSGCSGADPRSIALDGVQRLRAAGVRTWVMAPADAPPTGKTLLHDLAAAGGTTAWFAHHAGEAAAGFEAMRSELVAEAADCR